MKNNTHEQINRGVELMLRREKRQLAKSGLKIQKNFSFLKKKFEIKFEFTWEG